MDLNTVDWSRVCGAVAYSGGIRICTLAPHGEDTEHFWTPAEQVPDALEPCQASKLINGVLHLCGLYGRHVNRDHEWVRPSELRPRQIARARPNAPGPGPAPVRHPTQRDPLCLHPNPNGDGTLCALPPDHGLTGHEHYYVRLGGPGPGAKPTEPANGNSGDPPESGPLGSPPTRPPEEYESRRESEPGTTSTTPTSGGTSMSADELVGSIEAVIGSIREEIQGSIRHTADVIDSNVMRVQGLAGGAEVAAVHRALAGLQEAAQHLENAIQPTEAAIEHLAAWSVAIQQAHG